MKIYLCDYHKLPMIIRDYQMILDHFDKMIRERINRFKRQDDRYLALVREVMFSFVLKECFGTDKVVLEKNAYGKPMVRQLLYKDDVSDHGTEISAFDFSISHSGSVVVIAFGTRHTGIDAEYMDQIDFLKLLRFFTEEERERITGAENPEREFYRVWTYREAFSKEEGRGLGLFDKETVAIDYEKGIVRFHGRELYFREYPYPGYQITLCTEKSSEMPEIFTVDELTWEKMTAGISAHIFPE